MDESVVYGPTLEEFGFYCNYGEQTNKLIYFQEDDPVRAMALSQRQLSRSRPHPAYWAPFVVVLSPTPPG